MAVIVARHPYHASPVPAARFSFIETLDFLMVKGDHTPVTINGCNPPQL
jgi:hypothetical protein